MQCPRFGSENVLGGNISTEYKCLGKCDENRGKTDGWEYVTFWFDESDGTYSWPLIGASWTCHEDELERVLEGKLKPEIV